MADENVESVQTTESETTTESVESVLTDDTGKPAEASETPEVQSVLTTEETPKPGAPEKYELKLPEETTLEQAHVDEIAAHAKKQGLSNEQAQALVDRDNSRVQAAQQEHNRLVQEHYAKTLADAKSDSEIGGDQWPETVQKAQRFLNALGDAELKQIFHDNPDISNNKSVLKFMRRGYERFMAEGELVGGESSSPSKKLAPHEVFYGQDKEN